MSVALVVLAVLVAVICVPTAAGMTAMALAGGDGEPENWLVGLLAAIVGFGSVYNALVAFAAFWGLDGWRWWPMWAAPVAGLVGMLILDDRAVSGLRDRIVGVALQLAVALAPALVLVSGRVSV